jgi:hypothetical protein
MAHRTSSAALHASRVVLQHYEFTPKPEDKVHGFVPGLKGDETHVAVVIDYATNVFKVAELRPELRYWQERLHMGTATAPQIAAFFSKVVETFESVPKEISENKVTTIVEGPREFPGATHVLVVSKPAKEASRFLYHYYFVKPKRVTVIPDENLERIRIAALVDASMAWMKVSRALPVLRDCQAELKKGQATANDVVECLRKVGIFLAYLPSYRDQEEETKLLV